MSTHSSFPPPWLLAALQGIRQARLDEDAWLWVVACLLGYVLLSNLFWFVPALRPWSRGTALFAGRFFGFGLPPYLALQTGLVTTTAMGVAQLDWLRPFGVGLVAGAALLLIVALAAWHYRTWAATGDVLSSLELAAAARDEVPVLLVPFLAAAEQLYWAFLRAGCVAFLLTAGAPADGAAYWGAWAGFGLLIVSWLANTAWRHTARTTTGSYVEMLRLATALGSTVLFLLSGNLWVSWAFHVAASWLAQFARARVRRAVQHPPAV